MNALLCQVEIREERDIVLARQRARTVAARLGFEAQDQTRIATAVSEVARDAIQDARPGRIEFLVEGEPAVALAIRVVGAGAAMAGSGGSSELHAGPVQGLEGARRMMDSFRVEAGSGGQTVVAMAKALPRRVATVTARIAAEIAEELAQLDPPSPVEELLRQNRDLLRVLDELRTRELELAGLNAELEETNRGVLALYLELDERAASLKRASEMKTRFLSNVSHELRTPLTSIHSLSRLLLDRADGELSVEQERQVSFIHRAAVDLTAMVNDLLDLARIEAGHATLRLGAVDLVDLFGALRGMLRPLLKPGLPVNLVLEDPTGLPTLFTDEGKLAQILRNLLVNALHFTERGEVRLQATVEADEMVALAVSDTGIGIDPAHLDQIFEEFGQVDGPLQRQRQGTGLGLPLSRKLADLLGGRLEVHSEVGVGSTFSASIPIIHPGEGASVEVKEESNHV